MKRILLMLLVAVMCLSLAACSGGSAKKEIVGEWKSIEGFNFIFHEDGTGELQNRGSSSKFTWKYDKELSVYVVAAHVNMNVALVQEGETKYIKCSGIKCYTPEVYISKLPAYFEKGKQEFSELVKDFDKMELGEEYSAENISVKFDLKIKNGSLWLLADITNKGNEVITLDNYGSEYCPIYAGYGIEYYAYGEWRQSIGGFGLTTVFDGDITSIEPGKSGIIKTEIVKNAQYIKDTYGMIMGYVSCSVGNNEENGYIEFADKFSK